MQREDVDSRTRRGHSSRAAFEGKTVGGGCRTVLGAVIVGYKLERAIAIRDTHWLGLERGEVAFPPPFSVRCVPTLNSRLLFHTAHTHTALHLEMGSEVRVRPVCAAFAVVVVVSACQSPCGT